MDMLIKNGFKSFERQHPASHYKGNSVYRQHIEARSLNSLKESLRRSYSLIVPLRHPALCAKSWANRRKSIDMMLKQWHWLLDLVHPRNPLYLPIDSVEKDFYLSRIEKALSIELRTEWPLVGAKCCSYPMAEEDEAKVDSFVRSTKFVDILGHIY